MKRVALILTIVAMAGCSLPNWRVFQKKVDPKLAEKPPEQVEAERRGAKYLSLRSIMLEPDVRQQLLDIHAVAEPLSASLGEPAAAVTAEDKDAVIASLRKGILAEQKKAAAWKSFAQKYAGKELEGTGVDLAGIGGGLGLLAIVAACVLVPGFGTLVLFVIRRLRGTVQQMAQSVEEYAVQHPEAAGALKERFSAVMDSAHKQIIKREKQFINWAKVAEAKTLKPQAA